MRILLVAALVLTAGPLAAQRATVVRLVLLPAVLAMLGDRAWYLPGWLEWLPHVEIEGRR